MRNNEATGKKPSLLKGSMAPPSLATGIMNDFSAKAMANWIIQCAERYLQPLYDLMNEELLRSEYLHGDETRIQVINEPDQKIDFSRASAGGFLILSKYR